MDPLHGVSVQRPEIVIGALATWSPEVCLTQWQPTADYLSRAIPQAHFVVRPLTYEEFLPAIKTAEIDFVVTNPALYAVCEQTNCTTRVATRAYPQLAFAKLRHTDDELARRVAAALLQMPSGSRAANSADVAGWTIPLPYEPVHECLRQLRVGPCEHLGKMTLAAAVRAGWPWLAGGCFLVAVAWSVTGTILVLNRRLFESECLRREAEKFAASGRLAAMVAHEINNPMSGIVNCLHLVKATLGPAHPAQRYLAAAERETVRITRIVRQMLTLHRCRPETASNVHLGTTIQEVLLMLQPLAGERGVRVESRGPDQSKPALLPEESLRQVLFNLLTNAIEASSAGATVHVEASQSDSFVEIAVSDSGKGIPAEIRDRVLEPFFTTKTDCGGKLGLGLSISWGIVQSLGGTLKIDSWPGRGTRCLLHIPFSRTARSNTRHRDERTARAHLRLPAGRCVDTHLDSPTRPTGAHHG